jgi:hypothetical protein
MDGGRGERLVLLEKACLETLRDPFRFSEASPSSHLFKLDGARVVRIRYDGLAFYLRIHDDGRGIDPEVLRRGKRGGHWGLPGIHERAQRIGAKLDYGAKRGREQKCS